ncbi:hypothetical protein BDZ97DRAFT_1902271 [Flammula alnicola]|nr:hypothetical protein BDZ97DRAFT_1902271 [Flammula alnicola]
MHASSKFLSQLPGTVEFAVFDIEKSCRLFLSRTPGYSYHLHQIRSRVKPNAGQQRDNRTQNNIKISYHHYGGYTIFGFMVARLVGTTALLCLSAVTLRRCERDSACLLWKCPEFALTATFLYASIMAIISITSTIKSRLATAYNIVTLLSVLGVYMYRDLYPLATYSLQPADRGEGEILWAKISVLTLVAVFIPLFTPRRYVPAEPKNPAPVPNPEQTASWISRLTYTYVDAIILLASKVPHLGHDQLPPLSDDDYSLYQSNNAFPHLDSFRGAKRRHLFFGLMHYFRRDYVILGLSILSASLWAFVAPIGINKTLHYLEAGGAGESIRPWVWISFLLVGPLLQSVSEHWSMFTETKIRVRLQAVLTQLVFEHSLRIRLKPETSTNGADDGPISMETSLDASRAYLPKTPRHSGNLIGRINNLVTTDLGNMVEGVNFLSLGIFSCSLQIILSILFLNQILGWSALVGLATTLALTPLAGYVGKLFKTILTNCLQTDARVQNISEAVSVLRMIKLFGWEINMSQRLDHTREEELKWLWKMKVSPRTNSFIPTVSMLLTYAAYTVIMKRQLNASRIFSSMAVFGILREQLHRISWQTTLLIEGETPRGSFVSWTQHFSSPVLVDEDDQSSTFGFRDATFTWSSEDGDGSLTPSSRNFRLHIDGELLFRRNRINLIIGPTGSGKTSMLMALLGEMHFIPSNFNSWFNLPRAGGIAYAAQESWVQNATIRDNILFGTPYDEERYQKVIRQCALERDLRLFDAGDKTEARVTLARAIYSPAEIILLDDVLAALDVHTSAWIVDQCFRGDLVKGRTILLVTHNVALAGPIANFVVSIGLDGSVQTQGTDIDVGLANDPILALEVEHDKALIEMEKEEIQPTPQTILDGKLVVAEEIVEGHITWRSMKLLLLGFGGNHPILFFTWFLGFWGSQYETHDPSEVFVSFYLTVFTAILISYISLFSLTNFYYNYRSVSASRVIHANWLILFSEALSESLSTNRWLDETPTARIIARCTQDIHTIDEHIPQSLMWVIDQGIGALMKLLIITLFTPIFLFPGMAVGVLGIFMGNLYLKAQLSVKREMSNARSPLLAHFNAAIQGLVSLRAYGAQESFKDESHKRIDHYSRTARTSWNLNRWIGLRIDVLGASFTAGLASYLVYGQSVSASNTGFSLNMAVSFCTYIFWLIRIFNELEVESNSLERIQGYLDIDHEPKPTESGKPPASWPTSGDLRVENLSARYSQSGPKVLHDLSFHIASGQRIGIVGRTGSGKSSLTLALLRCILTEGTVYYDGIPTNTINLDALRSSITIIPQTPELLSGTLRQNLDPFDQNDDATLNDALRAAGLFSLQEEAGKASITLDSKIASGGNNLSVGQRQIIALARAMIRRSKLLILDEDYQTDSVIQSALRTQLERDVTIITVAHRLQTIMDADKIMVLDSGTIVEFSTPKDLLSKEKGALRALVEGSGDKSFLYALAEGM